jgi:hypothetical protein
MLGSFRAAVQAARRQEALYFAALLSEGRGKREILLC